MMQNPDTTIKLDYVFYSLKKPRPIKSANVAKGGMAPRLVLPIRARARAFFSMVLK